MVIHSRKRNLELPAFMPAQKPKFIKYQGAYVC